jgi:MoaA/NifB/PqqE/SkfB family radical SAM enzyme
MSFHMIKNGALAWLGLRPTPLCVTYEITYRCNQTCRYCDRHVALPNELATGEIFSVLEQFYNLGMRRISLDGGEPLLHGDISAVVDWLDDKGVVTVMNTNGLLVPKRSDTVRRLAKVKISLDGPEANHDAMRGQGSFQRTVAGIVAAKELGVEVELTCVVGKHNTDCVDELVDIAAGLGCVILFQPALNSLFLEVDRDGADWMADVGAVRRAFAAVERLKRRGRPVGNGWASLRHFRHYPEDKELPCAAGWVTATLDPEGALYACDQLNRDDRSNNVLERGVRQAFLALERRGCSQCWCARIVEGNYAWGCRVDYMRRLRRAPWAEE